MSIPTSPSIHIHRAETTDIPEIATLFQSTLRCINSRDYTPEEIEDWASCGQSPEHWAELIGQLHFLLALSSDGRIIGFASIRAEDGYLHSMFVHKDRQRCGVARRLLQEIETYARRKNQLRIHSEVSITARPFFEQMGYTVQKEQKRRARERFLTNYVMQKTLHPCPEKDYRSINKAAWNIKTDIHIHSDFYQNDRFLHGASSLNDIETRLLGPVADQSILHLQCHFGQDTISLSRMGAKVTGADLSDQAIDQARKMAGLLHTDTHFVCSDLYELPQHLHSKFDLVFTSYGVLGWLPDMKRWAEVVAHFLKPGGRFVIVEFHPVLWMFDEHFRHIAYSYFNRGAIEEEIKGSYADPSAAAKYTTLTWNHSLSDVVGSLLQASIRIRQFKEYDYSPYNCFPNMIQTAPGQYRIEHLSHQLPMLFAIEGLKEP